jgi:hypothetical protein
MFMNLDGTFYISQTCLKVTDSDPKELALLMCHELSHFLLDHQSSRVTQYLLNEKLKTEYFKTSLERAKVYDPVVEEFDKRTFASCLGCFYPHQRIVDKY